MLNEEADDPLLVVRKGASVPIGFETNMAVFVTIVRFIRGFCQRFET